MVVLAAVACSDGTDSGAATAGRTEPESTGGEVLDAVATAVASGGWVASSPVPEGGAVLVGAATSTGGRQRFDPAGIVLDREAEPTVEFDLPEPVFVTGMVAGDGMALLAGVVCEGTSREDENTGVRDCAPGTVVGYRVDLRSGEVTALPLPEAVLAVGGLMAGSPFSLLRSGSGSVVMVAGVGATDELRAWRLVEPDRWEPIEAPSVLPCQVGDHLVTYDIGGSTPMFAVDETEDVTISAQVFDAATDAWGDPIPGPALEGVVGMPPTVVCSASRLVAFPHRSEPGPVGLATFDPSTSRWEAVEVPAGDGQPLPLGHPGSETILVYRLGTEPAPAIHFDPVTAQHRPSALDLGAYVTFVPVTTSSAIIFRPDGTFSRADLGVRS